MLRIFSEGNNVIMSKRVVSLLILLLLFSMAVSAQVPFGWHKITGQPQNYSGVADGIENIGDRENSYAWSMSVLGDYLYVGTNRNVVGSLAGGFVTQLPESIPFPTDYRGRIYRMDLRTNVWEQFFVTSPTQMGNLIIGEDGGYRMMTTFTAKRSDPVLYVGSSGRLSCRLLAITPDAQEPVEVFRNTIPAALPLGFSIRAITEHDAKLFWASDYYNPDTQTTYPAIWFSANPLKDATQSTPVVPERIDVPGGWFPQGGEIMDMISYNNALYVFFLSHDFTPENMGFFVAKVKKVNSTWKWQPIVGNVPGAKYPAGLGDTQNGGITSPILFRGKIYVGTSNSLMVRLLATREISTGGADLSTIGARIFCFDQNDNWKSVLPPQLLTRLPKISIPINGQTLTIGALNGFANPLNQYMWRFGTQNGKLYVGTFDTRILLEQLAPDLVPQLAQLTDPSGFDLYSSYDGTIWFPESLDGFKDPFNYGGRTFATDPRTGDLYLGTANPFYGCQVWRKRKIGF